MSQEVRFVLGKGRDKQNILIGVTSSLGAGKGHLMAWNSNQINIMGMAMSVACHNNETGSPFYTKCIVRDGVRYTFESFVDWVDNNVTQHSTEHVGMLE